MNEREPVIYRAGKSHQRTAAAVDPVTTQILRHSLNSVAMQMRQTIIRAAFSPVIFEMIDFSCAIYDRNVRLLAQAMSMPLFMGSLSFCIEAMLENIGGEGKLADGDVFVFNAPYGTGSHANDAALIKPVFMDGGELVGYAVIKAHWLDIGGRGAYCTDTTDVYQEGVIFPGVRLFRGGVLNDDVYRMIQANSRVPFAVTGDVRAQAAGVHVGAEGLARAIERFGLESFRDHVEHMFDHGEALVRSYFDKIPDGRYVAREVMDDDGIGHEPITVEVALEVRGSTVRLDYSNNVPSRPGPYNCPLPTTVAVSRVAISMLAGAHESPNEGFFRPVEVMTRPGTIFHPLPPAPCFMYAAAAFRAIEAIYHAVAETVPELVPASSGADPCICVFWGLRSGSGEPWADGWAQPVGHGGHAGDDGATLMTNLESCVQMPPTEVWEHRNPWLFEKIELAADSAGAGKHQGGYGVDVRMRLVDDCVLTSTLEHTTTAPWGLVGGEEGRRNQGILHFPDGRTEEVAKVTGLRLPKGTVYELRTPGGGGWGSPAERDVDRIRGDVKEGYITEAYARTYYPHAFEDGCG